MSILERFIQDPNEVKLKTLGYVEWLTTGETISSVITSVSPVTSPVFVASAINSADRVVITSSGGVANSVYTVIVTITTSLGQVKEDCVEYIVEDTC